MSKEVPSQTEMRGRVLKNEVKRNFRERLDLQARGGTPNILGETLLANLDELGIDFNTRRTSGEILSFRVGIFNALRYAKLKKHGYTPREAPTTPEYSWDLISSVLQDPEQASDFRRMVWEKPSSYAPFRAVPLQAILNHRFGNEREIRGVDLGAGLGTHLADLNSQNYLNAKFTGKEKIERFHRPVNIIRGVSVDKQEREENILWALSSRWGAVYNQTRADSFVERLQANEDKFPFVAIDLLGKDAQKEIQDAIDPSVTNAQVDFVFSSFVRYQLDEDKQPAFINLVSNLLLEGGIWIDIGEELMRTETEQEQRFKVKVYEKKDGKIEEIGTAFTIPMSMNEGLIEAKSAYFAKAA